MTTQYVSRSEFARRAGVSPAAVTQACSTVLQAACNGQRIDAAHPDAVEYLESHTRKPPSTPENATPGLDPLYQDACELAAAEGRATASMFQRKLKVGYKRGQTLLAQLQANGVVPAPATAGATQQAPAPKPPPPVKTGRAAANENKANEKPVDPEAVPENIAHLSDMTLREIIQKFGTQYRLLDYLSALQKIEQVREKQIKNAEAEGRLVSKDLVQVGVIDVFNAAHLRLMTDGAKTLAAGVLSKSKAGAELSEIEAYAADIVGQFIRPVKAKIAKSMADV